ncbi:MAG: class A beta-lactamase-related serine hydrolase [Candidatus Omnitrophica bacterium]|nr:class A beta-lactamase-related serine hydrolase [Candidatus Omnitrophota bacterium]
MKKLILLIIPLVVIVFLSHNLSLRKTREREIAWRELGEKIEKKLRVFGGKAGILLKDLKTRQEISFNKKDSFPAASLIKVPIMLACFYAGRERRLNLEEKIVLHSGDRVGGSGILKNLPPGRVFTVERLIELMITVSDNTATNILIEKLGFDYLNSCFKRMSLKNTHLLRKMMDFRERRAGRDNFTNAEDIAYLLEKIYLKRFLSQKISAQCLHYLLNQKYRDRIPAKLPAGIKVAHKTGLERKICHDAGLVFGPKGDFIIVVLTQGEEIRKAKRFIADISSTVYDYYSHF